MVAKIQQNGEIEFAQFWALYPRREAKAHAMKMWSRLTEQEKHDAVNAIPNHTKKWEMEGRMKCHIPHAGTWLNPVDGRRWEDEIELEVAAPKQKTVQVAWWATQAGIIEQGRKLGISARPGESEGEFKQRIIDKLHKAA